MSSSKDIQTEEKTNQNPQENVKASIFYQFKKLRLPSNTLTLSTPQSPS